MEKILRDGRGQTLGFVRGSRISGEQRVLDAQRQLVARSQLPGWLLCRGDR